MILKTTYYDISLANIGSLIDYLNSISGKQLTITCIRQNLFAIKWSSKTVDLLNRCHAKAAAIYLTHLINKEDLNEYKESIRTTIADIVPYIRQIDSKEDCSFILLSTNTLPSSRHYKHAEWLFYKNRLPGDSNRRYDVDFLVLYALRLSLENRILGLLGIDYLLSNGKHVGLSRLLPLLPELENVNYNPEINWNEIKKVNAWLNHFMHRHLRPYPWIIHQVFEVLNPLLLPGQLSDGITIYGSIYASTFVKDEGKFQTEIELKIKKSIPDAEIKWLNSRKILRAKKK